MTDLEDALAERAAILEHDGGLPRWLAQLSAERAAGVSAVWSDDWRRPVVVGEGVAL